MQRRVRDAAGGGSSDFIHSGSSCLAAHTRVIDKSETKKRLGKGC